MTVAARDDGRDVAVVVVAYNSGAHLQRCLDALAAQTLKPAEIAVIDNASSDGGVDALRLPDAAKLTRNADNRGFAAACNQGVAATRAPLIALLNPDAFPEPDWLERLVAALEGAPDAASAASLQLMDADPRRLDGAGDVLHASGVAYRGGFGQLAPRDLPETGEIFGACAAAALYRRRAWEETAGFDERYFCYCEDVDLAYRLRLMGWRAVLARDAVVRHVGSASSGRRSEFAVFHGVRNRLWMLVKDTPAALAPLVVALHALATLVVVATALARGPAVAAATFRGLGAGIAGVGQAWAARQDVHRRRHASAWEIARAWTWSPGALLTRGIDVRPYRREAKGRPTE